MREIRSQWCVFIGCVMVINRCGVFGPILIADSISMRI